MFVNYNDFELLYLINDEGSEQAFHLLLKKYKPLIHFEVNNMLYDTDKRKDLYQEGYLILIRCIELFNDYFNASFYTYFLISLRRRLKTLLIRDDYYSNSIFYDDIRGLESSDINYSYYEKIIEEKTSKNGVLYFEDCICRGLSLSSFAKNNNLSYYEAQKIKDLVLDELKKNIEY